MENSKKTMEKIVALCKGRGFVYPGSEIYGGLANTWDYGPLGMALKNNLKAAWLKKFVQENKYNVGLDAAILMNPQTWVASGHVGGFSDPKMDCKECKTRHRADDLIEDFDGTNVAGNELYLRPETAQGIFVNFANIARTTRKKLPFGVCQVGKSFRNEITPGNFIFRVREFEQMELEFFCKPGTDLEWFDYWRSYCRDFLYALGIKEENLRLRDHDPKELAFYSKGTTDFEYLFPFGWGELWGIADRTDYDLNQHIKESGQSLDYFDPTDNTRYVPYVIEPSLGVERLFLATVVEAYDEEQLDEKDSRVVMHFHPFLAPFKAAVLPLSKKLSDKADAVREMLAKDFMVDFDDAGSIGKRYRRQDEIGTPFCITYDFDSVDDGCVTVRDRDTMQQERVKIDELNAYIAERVKL